MKQKILLIISIIISLTFSSCVSKKKYLEMESFKQRAETRVRELTNENTAKEKRIEKMIADFEEMKGQLMESNTIKNQLIDSLNGTINNLSSDVSQKDATIEEKIYAFEYEKRRLNEEINSTKQQLQEKEHELESLSAQINEFKKEITRLSFNLNKEQDETKSLRGQLQFKEEKIAKNQEIVSQLKTDIQKLKEQITEKDQTIEKLENNVKLLKNQL